MMKEGVEMKGILIDDSEFDRMEEECLRRFYGDEAYGRMKAEEEAEKNMSRRQRRKKKAMQGKNCGFDAPAYGERLPEGAKMDEKKDRVFKIVMLGEEDE